MIDSHIHLIKNLYLFLFLVQIYVKKETRNFVESYPLYFILFLLNVCIYDYVLISLIADIDIVDVNTNYI